MWHELAGTHETDPLYILMRDEGDEDEAGTYAATQDAATYQHNIHAEQESGCVNFGDAEFSLDETDSTISSVEDSDVDALIELLTLLKGTRK